MPTAAETADHSDVVVVGSANVDLVVELTALPLPGETVLALDSHVLAGGKGGNQATAVARLGRRVALVGRCGADDAGALVRNRLDAEGVDVSWFLPTEGVATGQALVMVDAAAENSIVVIAGANGRVTPRDAEAARDLLARAAVVVAQLEIPLEAVTEAARLTRGTFVLNAAPAGPLPAELLALVDVLVVNQTEFATVIGGDADADASVVAALLAGQPGGVRRVVITRGSEGARVWDGVRLTDIAAPRVDVVDTTGAGDTFVGALADALAGGDDLIGAAQWAVAAASLSTQALGATSGMPTAADVEQLLAREGANPP